MIESIKNNKKVPLYINSRLFSYTEKYIRAILYHEFTHIIDMYLFYNSEYANLLMSTYSEFNATRVEIMEKCDKKDFELSDVICGEGKSTTFRKEIEDNLETIIMISQIPKLDSKISEEKEGFLFNMLIKTYAYFFAYLSFFENTNSDYIEECFEKLNLYNQKELAKKMYQDVLDIEVILKNPTELIFDVINMQKIVFEEG